MLNGCQFQNQKMLRLDFDLGLTFEL